jgi:hypothetical protein
MKTEYHVQRTSNRNNGDGSWAVAEHLYDGTMTPSGTSAPRVTILSTHGWRHEAIDAAKQLAGDAMYYVNDAPNQASVPATREQITEFFG